ncbi:MAG: transglutaminase family protein [Siculibacillus sp.]|nr:transglutaminase family protein [Siculibacillus sp.]
MRLAITHETVFRFDQAASRAIQTLRLTPRNTEAQLVDTWRIDVSKDCHLSPVEDAFGNLTHTFSIDGPIDELVIVASGEVATEDTNGVLHATRDRLPLMAFRRETERTRIEPAVRAFAADAFATAGRDPLATLHKLMGRLAETVAVDAEAETRVPDIVLVERAARVEDVAHLFATLARSLDIPTRVAGGWLARGVSHTWIEAHLGPSLGWVGFDAVENRCPTDAWVRRAVGLDALDTAPVRGIRSHLGGETETTRITVREVSRA